MFPATCVDANCRLPWNHDRSLFTHYFERIIHFLAIGRYLQKNLKWFIAWHQFFFDAIFHPNHFWVKKNYTVLHTKISRSMGHLNPPWPNRFSLLCKATFFQLTNVPFLIISSSGITPSLFSVLSGLKLNLGSPVVLHFLQPLGTSHTNSLWQDFIYSKLKW